MFADLEKKQDYHELLTMVSCICCWDRTRSKYIYW